jgi:hypothetical protein
MDYNRIVAVTGMPGLYEVISSKTDGAIVRSLEDQSTKFVSSRVHNLSHLESIEVYTVRENVTLADVFSSMKEKGTSLPDVKDNNALRAYFEKVFPDLDFERVYASDMKKMVKWYEVLIQNEIDFTAKPEEEEAETESISETQARTAEVKKPARKEEEKPKEKARPATKEVKEEKKEVKAEKPKPAAKAAKKEAPEKKAAPKKAAAKKAAPKTAAKKSGAAPKKAAAKKKK